MNKHYIVLNGKRYDATTGALLSTADTPNVAQPAPVKLPADRSLRDGTSIASAPKHTPPKKFANRPTPSHVAPHKPQGGKTLMRRAVKRPVGNDFVTVKRQYPIQATDASVLSPSPKASANSIDPARLKRAHTIHKSSQIGRFISHATAPIRPRVAPVSVAAAPTHRQPVVAAPTANKQNIFEQALATATSHETKYKAPARKQHKKAFRVSAVIASLLVIGGVLVFLNRQTLEMQVASIQAGFNANAPSYVPSGYKKDTTAVEGKSVSINYVSPEDQTTYSLTQEPSDWNSESLLSTIVSRTGGTYRVLQHNGRTIYIYDGNKAAWVDGGVLYTITGGAPLSTDQITSIAASL